MSTTTREKVTVYIERGLKAHIEADRKRLGTKRGRSVTVSAYVESILSKHLMRREVGLEKRNGKRRAT